MIMQRHAEPFAGALQLPGHFDAGWGRGGVA